MANEIKCYVGKLILPWRKENKEINCTIVKQQTIYDKDLKLSYDIQAARAGISFYECIMLTIPSSDSIKKFIPNLTFLAICNSKLSKITSEDLKGFDWLRDLYVEGCEIEHLPGDLFKHAPNLEIISFRNNKIKYIDEGILEPLQNLKIFNLRGNVNINVWYDALNNNKGSVTLAQLKNEMRNKCKTASESCKTENKLSSEIGNLKATVAELKEKYEVLSGKFEKLSSETKILKSTIENQRMKIDSMKTQNITLKKDMDEQLKKYSDELTKISTLKANDEVQKREIAELKGKFEILSLENENLKKASQTEMNILREKNEMFERKLETVLQQFQEIKQTTKDFTIKVNLKHHSVQKSILIAHSKVIEQLINENPEADCLELKDISDETFQEIFNFMNDGSQPSEDANIVELFEASCQLEIEALTTIIADHLKKEVNQVNALDVLVICNKYDQFNLYEELKMKAFAEFQKNFPQKTLMPQLASKSEKLKLIMKAKLEMDEMIDKLHQAE